MEVFSGFKNLIESIIAYDVCNNVNGSGNLFRNNKNYQYLLKRYKTKTSEVFLPRRKDLRGLNKK